MIKEMCDRDFTPREMCDILEYLDDLETEKRILNVYRKHNMTEIAVNKKQEILKNKLRAQKQLDDIGLDYDIDDLTDMIGIEE